jgi:hypothetical protein
MKGSIKERERERKKMIKSITKYWIVIALVGY